MDSLGNVYVAGNSQEAGAASSMFIAKYAQLPLAQVSVASRKRHGSMNDFDLPITATQPGATSVTVEPRVIGAGHKIVFKFNGPVANPGTVSTTIGTASTAALSNEVVVDLLNVPDMSRVTISIAGVNGTLDAAATLGFLVGDVNNSGTVNASDISGVKARSGQPTDGTNFMFDLIASGTIDAFDISVVKAKSGSVLLQ